MIDPPKTREQAQAYGYGRVGYVKPYDESRCAAEVSWYTSGWPNYAQCSRKPGHGPADLYCKQHAAKVTK